MLLEHQRVTRAEFRAYIEQPENTEKWFELIDGVIHEVIMPKIIHAIIVQFVVRILGNFVYPRDLGHVIADGGVFNLPNGDVVIPDAAFVSKVHGTHIPDEYDIAPEIAVEVISPSNKPRQVNEKVESYLASGSRQVWVLYPDERVLDLWTPGTEGTAIKRKYTAADTLTGGDVLPGFSVLAGELFPRP